MFLQLQKSECWHWFFWVEVKVLGGLVPSQSSQARTCSLLSASSGCLPVPWLTALTPSLIDIISAAVAMTTSSLTLPSLSEVFLVFYWLRIPCYIFWSYWLPPSLPPLRSTLIPTHSILSPLDRVAFHWSPSVNRSSSPSNSQLPKPSQLGVGLQTSSLLRVGILSGLSLSTRTTSLLFPVVTLCLGLLQFRPPTFHSNPSDLGGGACRDVQLRAEWFTVLCSASWPVVSLCIHHHLLQKWISWMTVERGTMGTSISLLYHYYTYG